MQVTVKINATAIRINAVTGDAKINAITKINAAAAAAATMTLTSTPSLEVASSDTIAS